MERGPWGWLMAMSLAGVPSPSTRPNARKERRSIHAADQNPIAPRAEEVCAHLQGLLPFRRQTRKRLRLQSWGS